MGSLNAPLLDFICYDLLYLSFRFAQHIVWIKWKKKKRTAYILIYIRNICTSSPLTVAFRNYTVIVYWNRFIYLPYEINQNILVSKIIGANRTAIESSPLFDKQTWAERSPPKRVRRIPNSFRTPVVVIFCFFFLSNRVL